MKKICYVVSISLTIKSFFVKQLQHLSQNGFDVTVICSPDTELQNILGDKIKFIPIDIPRGISFVGSIKSIKKLTQIFKKEKFDIIQYSTPNAALYASIAAKKAKCSIRNYHLMGFRFLGASGIARALLKCIEKIACKNSTTIECVSQSNLELGIKEKVFSKDKGTIVWNGSTGGVDLSKFDYSKRDFWRKEIRESLNIGDNDFVFGFVGRITRDKGINELLAAFNDSHSDDKLLLVGNLEKDNNINETILEQSKHNPNILFHEFVSNIECYFAAIDVLVLPSYREGFGNVIIEAAAMGTPAIITDIPGPIDTVISNETALVVPVKDVSSLKNALLDIRKSNYQKMGVTARNFVTNNFDSEKLNSKILERKKYLIGKNSF